MVLGMFLSDMKGKFIVIYGINNIGKSTQARLLAGRLKHEGIEARYVKYPIYDLEPTGPRLDRILRHDAESDIRETDLQMIYAQNRRDFQRELQEILEKGKWVVAEDYTGTGIAWGWTKGADLDTLENMNRDLLKEDLAILLDGDRFIEGKEHNHIHERQDALADECRKNHLAFAERYGWSVVDANRSIDEVQSDIWEIVKSKLL